MIKIKKNNDDCFIEYIDRFDFLGEYYERVDVEEKIIREKIREVRDKLEKLINDAKFLSFK